MSTTPPPPPPSDNPSPFGDNPKAHAKAAKAYAKAQRPWYKKKRFAIPLALVVILVIASAAGGGDDEETATTTTVAATPAAPGDTVPVTTPPTVPPDVEAESGDDELDDVTITSCELDRDFGTATVALDVVNNSSKSSNYIITLGFTDETGAKVGDGFASTNNVEPGQTAKTEGFGTISDAAGQDVQCSVDEVERYAS